MAAFFQFLRVSACVLVSHYSDLNTLDFPREMEEGSQEGKGGQMFSEHRELPSLLLWLKLFLYEMMHPDYTCFESQKQT